MLWPVAIAILVIYLVKKVYDYFTFWRHLVKIPGPVAVPFWGNLFKELLNEQQLFERSREDAANFKDIYLLYGPRLGAINIYNPCDVEQVLTNNNHNTKSIIYDVLQSWLGTGLLTSTGSKWQSRRKILTPAFHFSILQEFVPIFNRETAFLVKDLEKRCSEKYIDVVQPITEFTLHSIAETSMGVQLNKASKDNTAYKKAVYDIGRIFMHRMTRIWLFVPWLYFFSVTKWQEAKTLKILHHTSRSVIEERKKVFKEKVSTKKRLAMLDLLLKARQNGANIDDEGLREEVDTFMFEGHDTTSVAICYALVVLANHKDVQDKILEEIQSILGDDLDALPSYHDLQEMKYLERCIKESLRLFPSVPLMGRIAGESFTTKTGYYIPKGTMINILIYDMHRRADIYENPLKFDPDRFLPDNIADRHPFAYIPFSAGSRNCIGQKYAILEIKAALCGILRKFILEPIDTPESLKMKADLVLRPDDEIKVRFVLRKWFV